MAVMTAPTVNRRTTRQRTAVMAALRTTDEFASAQQLHARLRVEGGSVGLATVYRALQQLADDDKVDVRRTEDGEATYRLCSSGHHHHLVCRSCGRTVEVQSRAVERWAATVAQEQGFTGIEHMVEITGTCAACAAQDVAPG